MKKAAGTIPAAWHLAYDGQVRSRRGIAPIMGGGSARRKISC
jgi:hypothetical protein